MNLVLSSLETVVAGWYPVSLKGDQYLSWNRWFVSACYIKRWTLQSLNHLKNINGHCIAGWSNDLMFFFDIFLNVFQEFLRLVLGSGCFKKLSMMFHGRLKSALGRFRRDLRAFKRSFKGEVSLWCLKEVSGVFWECLEEISRYLL